MNLRPPRHDLLRRVEAASHLRALVTVPQDDRHESPRVRVASPSDDLVVVRLRELGGPGEDLRVLIELGLPSGRDGAVRRGGVHDWCLPADFYGKCLRGV